MISTGVRHQAQITGQLTRVERRTSGARFNPSFATADFTPRSIAVFDIRSAVVSNP
jgi:hypothetical protein